MNFPLQKSLQVGKTTIDRLVFREHTTAADYLAFDQPGGVRQRIALIASLTGTDVSVIERLSGVDYNLAVDMADKLIEADEKALKALNSPDEANEQQLAQESDEQRVVREAAEKK